MVQLFEKAESVRRWVNSVEVSASVRREKSVLSMHVFKISLEQGIYANNVICKHLHSLAAFAQNIYLQR